MNKLTFWDRLTSETPKFFVKLRAIALSVAGSAGVILAAPKLVEGITIPPTVQTICTWLVVAGLVAAGNSSLPVKNP